MSSRCLLLTSWYFPHKIIRWEDAVRFYRPAASQIADQLITLASDVGWADKFCWAAWCFHPSAGPQMLQDWTYAPTYFGQIVKDELAKSVDLYEDSE